MKFVYIFLQSHGGENFGTSQDSGDGGSDSQGIINTMTSRVKLNFKVLGVQVGIFKLNGKDN